MVDASVTKKVRKDVRLATLLILNKKWRTQQHPVQKNTLKSKIKHVTNHDILTLVKIWR